jgi:sugar phosphate isomerase/epimerase
MKSAVTVSLVPEARSGPFVFHDGLEEGCRRASALGFDAVEIFPPSAAAIKKSALKEVLDKHGLRLAAMGTGAGWLVRKLSLTSADPGIRTQAKGFIREIIELAGEFEAPAIIGSMQGRWEGSVSHQQASNWLAEALEELGGYAATWGQVLLYEPLNRYETNMFNRAGDAAAFLDRLVTRNIRVLADLFHMNIEESSIADALRGTSRYIGHVHFADSNRRAVGFGHTNFAPIIGALREMGFEGFLSAEIFPSPDSDTAARKTMESFRHYTTRPC